MGASGSYKIYGDDLEQYIKEYGDYLSSLSVAVENAKKAIQDLVDLPSFSGSAADSIKRYFSDVHIQGLSLNNMVTEAIQTALTQAFNDYRCANTGGVSSHFVPEDCDDFYFTSQEFLDKQTWINNDLKETKLQSITDEIRASQYDLEGTGISITPVSTATLWESLDELVHVLQDMDQGVSYIDSEGAKRFQDNSLISDTLHALQKVLTNWTSSTYDITNYPTNLFSEALSKGGATELLGNLVTYIDEHHDEMVQTWQDCANMVYNRDIAEKEREVKDAQLIGLLLGICFVIVGVVAIVAPPFAATGVYIDGCILGLIGASFDVALRIRAYAAPLEFSSSVVFKSLKSDTHIISSEGNYLKGNEVNGLSWAGEAALDAILAFLPDSSTKDWVIKAEDLTDYLKPIMLEIEKGAHGLKLSPGQMLAAIFQHFADHLTEIREKELEELIHKLQESKEEIKAYANSSERDYSNLPCFQLS